MLLATHIQHRIDKCRFYTLYIALSLKVIKIEELYIFSSLSARAVNNWA
jgi:hypothetical protein